jgi:hypothetical protein
MFGKLTLILATLGSVSSYKHLRGPGNLSLVLKTNISNALVPYQKFIINPLKCPNNNTRYGPE